MAFKKLTKETVLKIPPAEYARLTFMIKGRGPLVINKFPNKVRDELLAKHVAGDAAKTKTRPPKNVNELYENSRHVSTDGWDGFTCGSLKAAMVSACRTIGVEMTRAKLALWVVPQGKDRDDGTDLIRVYGTPAPFTAVTRNANGMPDVRVRARFEEWYSEITIEYDPGMITAEGVASLVQRAGRQVGLCEGRQDSKRSTGMGWGSFEIATSKELGDKLRKAARRAS